MLRRGLAVLLGVALVAGACADDSDDAGDGGGEEPSTADLTGPPVPLMVLVDGGGGAAFEFPNVFDAAQVAVDAIHADGGIDGSPIEMLTCETEGNPNKAGECAREAVDAGVTAVVGAFTTFGDNYMPVLEEAGIPSVAPFAISFPEFASELSFPVIGGAPATTAGMGAQLADAGFETINVSYLDIEQGALAATLVGEGLAPRGLEVASETPVPQGTGDFGPQLSAAQSGGTDGIVVALASDDADRYVQQAAQAGVEPQLALTSASLSPDAVETLGSAAEGLFVTSNFKPTTMDDPGVERFLDEVERFDPDLEIDDPAINAWAGMHLVADVLAGSTDFSPATLVEALNGAADIDLGVIPPISFDVAPEPLFGGAITRLFNQSVLYATVEEGEIVAETGEFVNPFVAP